MQIRSRTALRAGAALALTLTAFPAGVARWTPVQQASAAHAEVRGYSQSLLAQAAKAPMHMIFQLRGPGASEGRILATLQATGARDIGRLDLVQGISAQVTAATLTALRFEPDLALMAMDRLHQPIPVPDQQALADTLSHGQLRTETSVPAGQTLLQQPDALSIIHADTAQKRFDGRGVRLALVDSGIDIGHPDLQGIMLEDAAGKPLYADFTGSGDLTDTVGHGTACAGLIAAQSHNVYSVNNTYRVSVYPVPDPTKRFNDTTYFRVGGVAPGVKIMAAKIFDARVPGQGAYDSNIIRAIQWAIDNHADVISESFGNAAVFNTNPATDVVAQADELAVRKGITVVASNGNAGPGQSTVGSPAQAPDVIAVGASTDYQLFDQLGQYVRHGAGTADNLAPFSSRGPTYDGRVRPDLLAPGAFGWSLQPRNPNTESTGLPPYLLTEFGGTSMAAPIVAGTAALVVNAYMETHHGQHPSPSYVKQVLTSSADDLGYPAADQAAGRVDAQRAIDLVTRTGASVLLSGALALHGQAGDRVSGTVTLTNSGAVGEDLRLTAEQSAVVKRLSFGGTAVADQFQTYQFTVPAGLSKLVAGVYWNKLSSVPLPGQTAKTPDLRIRLYDPQGRFVNYQTAGDGQSASAIVTAGRPTPGRWTALVVEGARPDAHKVAHYSNVPFSATITLESLRQGSGSVSPAHLRLAPGQRATVTFISAPRGDPGTGVATIRVRERSLATPTAGQPATPAAIEQTIPVGIVTDIAMRGGLGRFAGVFAGADNTNTFDEQNYYSFVVPQGTQDIVASLAWPHSGNWFLMALLDPQGRAYNLVDNALVTTSQSNPSQVTGVDLSLRTIDSFIVKPLPGRWRVELFDYQFAGTHDSEPYAGLIRFNVPSASLDRSALTVQPGGDSVPFSVEVTNHGVSDQVYAAYPTTNSYTYLPLGGTGGTLQQGAQGVGSTQVLSYTTSFVPPGTREIISQAQALNSPLPVTVQLSDPALNGFAQFGAAAPVALGGTLGQGTAVVERAASLPIGKWGALLTLPAGSRSGPVYVAASSQAYALTPNPWISLDFDLQPDGSFSGKPKLAIADATVVMQGKVSVPATTAPGTYHAHIFIYSFRGDQVADLPLTIRVAGAPPNPSNRVAPPAYLAALISTQYFPEGETGSGVLDQIDLVNPNAETTHAQIRLLTATGWTTVNRYSLPPHARLSVDVAPLVGGDQRVAAVVQADRALVSGRRIARTDAAGSYSVGTVAPSKQWYFADGYTVGSFRELLRVLNPSGRVATIHLHLVSDQGTTKDVDFQAGPSSRVGLTVGDLLAGKAISATISSDVAVVAERTEVFGTGNEGLTTAVGATAPLTAQYLDPGHLPARAQAHLALYNPLGADAKVNIALLNAKGVTTRTVQMSVKAGRRATLDLQARYGTANLGARITSDTGVVAEKVSYFGDFAHSQVSGSDLLGVAAPAAHFAFPGGTTAGGSSDRLSLFNPGEAATTATLTAIYDGNQTTRQILTIPAGTRIGVSIETLGLPSGPSSLLIDGTTTTPFYATQTLMNAGKTDGSEISGVVMTPTRP